MKGQEKLFPLADQFTAAGRLLPDTAAGRLFCAEHWGGFEYMGREERAIRKTMG